MERLGLVLLVVVSFVAAGSIPEQHWAVQRKETVRKATIKVYSPVDNKFVGAINLSQLGANVNDLIVLGRLWGLLPGRYYGIVYEAAPGKVDNACASTGPAVMRYNAEDNVNEELCLFDQSIGDDTERTIGWFALDASLSESSSNNIGNHVVKIYAYSDKEESTVGFKPAVESPVACGVVNDKPLPSTYVEGFHDLEAVKTMEYRTLGKTGLLVSKLSFGGGPLGCHYGTFNEAEAIETIRYAIRQGVNYIDTAPWYGQGRSEAVIGKALQGIPRKAYYIATKIGRYELDFDRMFDFSVEKTRKSLKTSLELLHLDYVDVIQVHDIEFAPSLDIIVTHTLPELSKQVRDGKARFIGITGYPVSILMECIEKSNITISCVLTYSRYTLIDETLLDYVDFFKKNNIGIINAAGACMGLLTNGDPPEWHPASEQVRMECAKARQCCKDHDQNLARLAIWNSMQCESVATNLVGMQNMSDLMSNLDVMRNGISDKEKDLLRDLQEKYFAKVKGCHWEGCDIEAYRKATNRL